MDNWGSIWILAYLKPLVGINYSTIISIVLYIWDIIEETDLLLLNYLKQKTLKFSCVCIIQKNSET